MRKKFRVKTVAPKLVKRVPQKVDDKELQKIVV